MLECHHDAEDLVVRLAHGQALRQLGRNGLGLQHQFAGRSAHAFLGQRDAGLDVALESCYQFIQETAGLPGIAGDLAHAFFVCVQLFERDDGDEQIMLVKPEQRGGIVHQNIGIEHKQFGQGGGGFFLRHDDILSVMAGTGSGLSGDRQFPSTRL